MDVTAACFQCQGEGGASSSSITAMPWEIMLELVKHMDSKNRSAWRLVNKAASQAVYEGTTALAPSSTAIKRSIFTLPLLSKCSGLEQLSCKGLSQLSSIQGLPPGLTALDISGTAVPDLSPLRQCTGLRQLSAIDIHKSIDVTQLAAVLLHLTGLQRLDLRGNGLWKASNLAPALQGLLQLQHLHLSHNSIGAWSTRALAPALQALVQLQHLDLARNCIGVGGAQALAPALQGLRLLQHLELSGAELHAGGVQALAPALMRLTWLLRLELRVNKLRDEGARALAPALQRLTKLQQLGLSHNELGPAGITALSPSIKELRALQRLDLDFNAILLDAEAAHALALAMWELPGLQVLELSFCHLTPGAAQALGPAIMSLPHLEVRLSNRDREMIDEAVAALSVYA